MILLVVVETACAQGVGPSPESFAVEWHPRSQHLMPGFEGYVHNRSEYRVGSVRLKVEVLDGNGRVVREQLTWVYGAIDSGGTGHFTLRPLGPQETYRIAVESFDLLSRQAP
jgi:hypothetical protein